MTRDITRQVFKAHNVALDSTAFAAFWDLGYQIVAVRDTGANLTDLMGDAFNPEVNPDITPAQLRKEKRQFKTRVEVEEVGGCGLALEGVNLYASFIWGFVGNDFIGSGYDREIVEMLAARPVEEVR